MCHCRDWGHVTLFDQLDTACDIVVERIRRFSASQPANPQPEDLLQDVYREARETLNSPEPLDATKRVRLDCYFKERTFI